MVLQPSLAADSSGVAIAGTALVDSACEANLISASFAKQAGLQLRKLQHPLQLLAADARPFATISHAASGMLSNSSHIEHFHAFVVPNLPRYNMILGGPWLESHNPFIDWQDKTITMSSPHCLSECCSEGQPVVLHTSVSTSQCSPNFSSYPLPTPVRLISASAFYHQAQKPNTSVYAIYPESFLQDFTDVHELVEPLTVSLSHLALMDGHRQSEALHNALENSTRSPPSSAFCSSARITAADLDKHLRGPTQYSDADLRRLVPEPFHRWLSAFKPDSGDFALPPHRPEDHTIDLLPGATPPFTKNYRPVPLPHREAVRKTIEDLLRKGAIRPSSSTASSPILLVAKPSGGVRMCVDYRKLNDITVKRRFPIPLLSETLSKAKFYTKLDVRAAFNQLRIRQGDEWLTSFCTRYGQFEWLVMPFGLCNAPATWQAYINSLIRPWLDVFVTAYLDDILIYSDTYEDHIHHVQLILDKIVQAGLPLDVDKCHFVVQRVEYLGVVLTPNGVEMDPKKVSTITSWPVPTSPRELHRFVGFCNFYRRFIPNFSRVTGPLNQLLHCKVVRSGGRRHVLYPPFAWTPTCAAAFNSLKQLFASATFLAHYDPSLPTVVETDASDLVVAGVLSQRHDDGLRPVAFYSRRMTSCEGNYAIYDKELLAIVKAFETWKPELIGLHAPIRVLTDHQSLKYFMTSKQLSSRQARWAEFLSQFSFLISYRAGKDNTVADLLSRPSDLPEAQKAQALFRTRTLLAESSLDPDVKAALSALIDKSHTSACPPSSIRSSLVELSQPPLVRSPQCSALLVAPIYPTASLPHDSDSDSNADEDADELLLTPLDFAAVRQACLLDDDFTAIVNCLDSNARQLPSSLVRRGFRFSVADFSLRDGLLYVQDRVFVPNDHDLKLSVLSSYHDSRVFGHPSEKTLFRLISRYFWWLGLRADCSRYTSSCLTCRRAKPNNFPPPGFLQSLPLPQRIWSDVTLDLAEDLPLCVRKGRAFRHILVIVDRLSKDRIFEPLMTKTAEEIVEVVHRRLFCVHGYPITMISDRGSAFMSTFMRRYAELYHVKLVFATVRHPQTDGQSEAVIKSLKTYLREFVNFKQDDWVDFLPDAEFVSRNWPSHTTAMSPFFAVHGFHPRSPVEPLPADYHRADPESADAVVSRTTLVRRWLKDQLVWAHDVSSHHADRRTKPPSVIRPGDLVFVDEALLRQSTDRPSSSLRPVRLGPWPVLRSIRDHAFEVDIPPEALRAGHSNVINRQYLRLAVPLMRGQRHSPSPILRPSSFGPGLFREWDVDSIVGCRLHPRRGLEYLALYKDQDDWNRAPRWQPWVDFEHAVQKVLEYHADNPDAPSCPFG